MTIARTEVGYRDLLADLRHPGCPACRGGNRAAWGLIDSILWESVNDPGTRIRLRASHGFCRDHFYMAAKVASSAAGGVGMAILVEDFLRQIESEAEMAVAGRSSKRRQGTALTPTAGCMACGTAIRVSVNYLRLLARSELDDELGLAIRQPGRGICLPHLALGIRRTNDPADRRRLLAHFKHGSQELRGELSEFIRKHDYRYHDEEMTDAERDAWPRAVARLVGEPRPSRPPRR